MKLRKVLVAGAGQMGAGIVLVAAQAGLQVTMIDVADEFIAKGVAGIDKQLARAVEKGRSTQQDADDIRGRINGTTDYGALADCDLVIEAITENLALKLEMWKELDGIVKGEAVFATNTSSLSVTETES